jgi:hypothetical protein
MNKISNEIGDFPKVERKSISSESLNAFENVIKKKVLAMKVEGYDINHISKFLNLDKNYIEHLISPTVKTASTLEQTENISETVSKAKYNKNAQDAYDSLHKKSSKTNTDGLIGNVSSIMPSRAENMSDMGGPSSQLKTKTSNTIWEPYKIEKLSKVKRRDEETKDEKKKLEEVKKINNNHIDFNKLAETLLSKKISGGSEKENSTSNYINKIPKNGISIFEKDKKAFSRIEDKTEGEKVSSNLKKPKDKTSVLGNKSVTSSDIFNKMFNKLTKDL